jgi:four helix bundle protein
MAASLKDLKIWQESVALAGDIVRLLRQASRRETKALTDRIMLTALAVAEQVADAHSRHSSEEQQQIYRTAKRDLMLVETQIAVARHAEILPASANAAVFDRIQLLHRLLAGYLVYLDRHLKEETAEKR